MNGIKRFAAAILCLLLCAPAFGAIAEGLTAGPVPVYLDQDGAILDREGSPVSREPADKIIYHDETLLVFLLDNRMLAKTSDDMLKHFGVQVCDPVWAGQDGCIYYVRENAPTTLMCMKPEAATGSTACTTEKPIQALRCGVNGVLVQVDGMEYLYVPALRRLIKQDIPANTRLIPGEKFEARLSDAGALSVVSRGEAEAKPLAQNVLASAVYGDSVYYLQALDAATRLMAYRTTADAVIRMYRFQEPLLESITAHESGVCVMGKNGALYFFPFGQYAPQLLCSWQDERGFVPRLESQGDLVVLYDVSFGQTLPYFVIDLSEGPSPTPVPAPDPTPAPTPVLSTLSRGSTGEAVRLFQERLKALGYPVGSADGIFGAATERAVRFVQSDLGRSQTGVADAALQRLVQASDAPVYAEYVTLRKGDSGIRVEEMQQRLRELYYTKEDVDGYYGSATSQAVERFQAQMKYTKKGDVFKASQIKALFKKSAPDCTRYFTLRQDDNAPVVKRLNARLKKLGYLKKSPGEAYSKKTVAAVKAFQAMAALPETGIADADTQRELFKKAAPTPTPTPDPTPMPPDVQAVSNAVVKTMRVWMTNNLGGAFDKVSAVLELQGRLRDLNYMVTEDINGVYNETTLNAVKAFQLDEGLKVNGKADKKTLRKLYGI
jgi:peptidoglycan hydrolase-like protein with peptidoglycan-binding domain